MGSITRTLFGGSKSKQMSQSTSTAHNESGNLSLPFIQQAFGGMTGQASQAGDMIGRLLGINGGADRGEAFGNFRSTPGYDFARSEGLRGIAGNFSGRGVFSSGARDKAMMKYATGLADQTYGNYMDRLFGYGQQGLGAGQLLSGAGQYSFGDSNSSSFSKGKSTSQSGGLGNFLGAIMASERGLKENIVKLGEYPDGLGIYEYDYIDNKYGDGKQIGVMVDEVRKFRPWALGPVIDGVQTVDYSKLEGDK